MDKYSNYINYYIQKKVLWFIKNNLLILQFYSSVLTGPVGKFTYILCSRISFFVPIKRENGVKSHKLFFTTVKMKYLLCTHILTVKHKICLFYFVHFSLCYNLYTFLLLLENFDLFSSSSF